MYQGYQGTADEYIDSRDLIEYAEDEDNQRDDPETVAAIRELEDSGIEDWSYGAHFIREDVFEDYAQELAEDIGAIDSDASWPLYCIDWERAANDLKMDYSAVEFLGHTYFVR